MIWLTERVWPLVLGSLRLVMPARTRIDEGDEPCTQCAAVRIHVDEITEPPQKWLPELDWSEICQGCVAIVVLEPPTISRWLLNRSGSSSRTASPSATAHPASPIASNE